MDFTDLEYFLSDQKLSQSTEYVLQSNATFSCLYDVMSKM